MPPTRKTRKRTPTNNPLADPTEEEEVGRPPNAWILYRGDHLPQIRQARSPNDRPLRQAEASRLIAAQWRAESSEVRQKYEKRAEIVKAEHAKAHPDWKYRPRSKAQKAKDREAAKAAKKLAQQEARANAKASKAAGPSTSPRQPAKRQSSGERSLLTLPEPVDRGSGPSPPLDSGDESSSSSFTASLPSDGEGLAPPPSEGLSVYGPALPYPHALDLPPVYAPTPSYLFSFGPMDPSPSSQGSGVIDPLLLAGSADSPGTSSSHADQDLWQCHPPTPADMATSWQSPSSEFPPGIVAQTPPALLNPSGEGYRPMGNPAEGFNVGDPNGFMPVPPSGPLDLQHSTPPTLLGTDLLMQGGMVGTLNMAELQEGVEDATSQTGVMPYGSDFPFSIEELAAFQRSASELANSLADPATYFYDQANQAIAQYCNYGDPLQSSLSEVTEPGALESPVSGSVMLPHGSVRDGSAVRMGDFDYAGFDFSPLHPRVDLQVGGSVPSFPPTPATSVEPALPPMDAPLPDHAAVSQYSSEQPRYVPPAGAGFMSRRRVGGHYVHPPAAFDSAGLGSGMA